MNKRLERMLKNYPAMVRERDSIAHQIAHFKGLNAEEVIESMYTAHSDGERVQTSNLSDKTAQIAMNYQDKMERITAMPTARSFEQAVIRSPVCILCCPITWKSIVMPVAG